MPLYFFNLHDGKWDHDDIGSDLNDVDHAISEANQALPAIALDRLPRDGGGCTLTMVVTNEFGQPIYTATLSLSGCALGA